MRRPCSSNVATLSIISAWWRGDGIRESQAISLRDERAYVPALGRAPGLRRSDLPGTGTYHAVLVLEPADDEAGRELSSGLEDVAHSTHNGAGAQPLVLTAGHKTRPPGDDRLDDRA